MSAYDDQDVVLSRRLRELVRLAGAGELQDVASEPGGPYARGPQLNGYGPGSPGAAPLAAHQQGGSGTGPEEPDLPDGPHAPETPHAPDAPDVPESPELPPHEAPEAPDLPDLPGVPDVPEVGGPAEMPEIPGTPDVLRSPEIPPTPDIPPAPHVPDMPDVPEAPEIPESPGIYDEPVIPEPPRIDDPDLPELDRPVDLPGPPAGLPGTPGDPSAPNAPDVPRPPDLPDPPHKGPGGPDAVLDAVTAMHSNHTNTMRFPDEPGQFGHEQPDRPQGSEHPDRSTPGASPGPEWREATVVPPPATGGHGGQGGSGGGLRGTGGGGGGDGEHGPVGDGHDGDDSEVEAALRRMLHQSVRGIEPAPEALTHLKHAVPARRAHRRRALVGAAAAVVLAGVGFPGLVSAGLIPGIHGDSSINAGEGSNQAQSAGGANGSGLSQGPGNGSGGASGNGGKSGGGDGSASPSPTQGAGSEGGDPNDTLATSAPSCGRQQLGHGTAATESPDSEGKVYGSFRVVNTSSEACTVEGEGVVGASAHGHADIERINVLDHTPGDAATALPDPDLAASELVLKPGQAYEVKWAWVPSDCEVSGDPEPKAQEGNGPEGSQGGNNGNSGGNDSGGSTGNSGGSADGGSTGNSGGDGGQSDEEASVVLSHTPDVGDPAAANTELEGACAGTLYRTGVLAAD